jgi:polyisoprenoid-binding protein YceI
MRVFQSLTLALLLASGSVIAAPAHYTLDPNHTQVHFSWSHFGFSHPAGRFDRFTGDFNFDPVDPTRSTVTVTIPVDSMDTGVAKLDEHLKGPEFFDAARYPDAVFKSRRVERSGDHALKVTGDLTLHGVTKPVVLDVTINKVGTHPMGGAAAGFDATTTISRSAFGIDNYVPNVSDAIAITITAEAHADAPKAK